ncbi:MAG: DUF72 domain-containing protein [Candidatus Jordarchaeum sp.]|uniref:DUF72 domain-containing protein n=1 Tax=Candidatus Jordarchaeum sp. TaxID=2823881 RepID=UPI004049EE47
MDSEFYVGTSGWMYNWNKGGSFDWYLANSGLNCVELNASYYRFPFRNMVASWVRKTPEVFKWAIKVNRYITHVFRFSERALGTWIKFRELFQPLDKSIDFYLFQLPPSSVPREKTLENLERFVTEADLGERFALEPRNIEWFDSKWVSWAEDRGVTLVSVDAPELPRDIFHIAGVIYLRMHGRTGWYSHRYDEKELEEVKRNILGVNPRKVFVFFNNDHAMLDNAQSMLSKLMKK